MTEEKVGMLTVIGEAPPRRSPSGQLKKYALVRCECGTIKEVRGAHLKSRATYSCGCVKLGKRKHGGCGTRLYNIWCGMKQRCYDKSCKSYKWWGGKGVTVCQEWLDDFSKFKDWAFRNGYSDNLTIDRVNNAPQYSPETCEWVTLEENIRRRDEVRSLRCGV